MASLFRQYKTGKKQNSKTKKKKKTNSSKKTKSKPTNIATLEEAYELTPTTNSQEEKSSDCAGPNKEEKKEKTKIKKKNNKTKKKPSGSKQHERGTTKQKPTELSETKDHAPALDVKNAAEADEIPSPQRNRERRSRLRKAKDDVSVDSKTDYYGKSNTMWSLQCNDVRGHCLIRRTH